LAKRCVFIQAPVFLKTFKILTDLRRIAYN
jgi:hypothetical protein